MRSLCVAHAVDKPHSLVRVNPWVYSWHDSAIFAYQYRGYREVMQQIFMAGLLK